MICAYWCLSSNFGDALTPWIIERIRRERPAWVSPTFEAEHYIVSGSVLNLANRHAFIWGAGIASLKDSVTPLARIFAVRGPISRALSLASGARCPAIYGDPAMILPRLYDKTMPVEHDIGYVPHYVDQYRVSTHYPGEKIINVLDPIEKVIDDIRSCKRIVSSALHPIIVAHAYGIPAAWVQWSDSIGGDGTKYRDYFMSVKLDVPNPIDRRENRDEIPSDAFVWPGKTNTADFWGACPIRRSGE